MSSIWPASGCRNREPCALSAEPLPGDAFAFSALPPRPEPLAALPLDDLLLVALSWRRCRS
jgi:hypothetical protein